MVAMLSFGRAGQPIDIIRLDVANGQVPSWSKDDRNFFLHGSMSTEFVPESVLRSFMNTYPELFPNDNFGLDFDVMETADVQGRWPIGFSRKKVHPRLRGMNAQLQGIEVERVILGDDDFAVEHAARGQLCAERLEQFREVAVQ